MNFEVIHYQQINSTNSELKEQCQRQNVKEGTVILADFQTAGRGTSGNIWQAEAGKNLLCSILFQPQLEVEHHFGITQFVSLALTDTLQELQVQAQIKWPNDIYVGRQKIAGILIENTLMGSRIQNSVVGIGLNVNQADYGGLPNPVSLHQLKGIETDIRTLLKEVLTHIGHRYQQLIQAKFKAIHQDYLDKLFLLGQPVRYLKGPATLEGVLNRVSESGELEIEDAKGTLHKYLFGEVKLLVADADRRL